MEFFQSLKVRSMNYIPVFLTRKAATLLPIFVIPIFLFAQGWETEGIAGYANPITGYGEVVKAGWSVRAQGSYRFLRGFATGFQLGVARFAKDKNPTDSWNEAKITTISMVGFGEFEFNRKTTVRPYVAGGIGATIFVVSRNTGNVFDKDITNVSFTLSPRAGLKIFLTDHLALDLNGDAVLIADGPPIGFPKANLLTGYFGINGGIAYRFKRNK